MGARPGGGRMLEEGRRRFDLLVARPGLEMAGGDQRGAMCENFRPHGPDPIAG